MKNITIVCNKPFNGYVIAIKECVEQMKKFGINIQLLTHEEYIQGLRAKESSCIILDDPWESIPDLTTADPDEILEFYRRHHAEVMTSEEFYKSYLYGNINNERFKQLLEANEKENMRELRLKRSAKGGLQHGPEQRGRRGKAKRW